MQNSFSDPRTGEILDIIAKETGVARDALVPDVTLEELGIPSLDLTQAVFEIESHFGIEIPVVPDRKGAEFDTIGGLVAHILTTLDQSGTGRSEARSGGP